MTRPRTGQRNDGMRRRPASAVLAGLSAAGVRLPASPCARSAAGTLATCRRGLRARRCGLRHRRRGAAATRLRRPE